MSFSTDIGGYYFSGMGSNGFFGVGEQSLPNGFQVPFLGAEARYNNYAVSLGLTQKHNEDQYTQALRGTFYLKDGGSCPYLSVLYAKNWILEENWGWVNESFEYISLRRRDLFVVDVGYQLELESINTSVNLSVGIAKGVDSFRFQTPMPVASVRILTNLANFGESTQRNFN